MSLRCRFLRQMNEAVWELTLGIVAVTAGVAILLKLDALAKFDQRCGAKLNTRLRKRLGDSWLTHDIYSAGTPSGLRKSRIGLGIAGVGLILGGLAISALALKTLLS